VQTVTDEDQVGKRLLAVRRSTMAVVVVQQLLEREERGESREDQQESRELSTPVSQARRNHVQQGAADQGARGKGDERQHYALQHRPR
jgi:hypothetical protein